MNDKYNKLINYLKELKSLAIAFSGGVDSTFLVAAAKEALGDNVTAFTIKTPYIPEWELSEAKELTNSLGIKHEILDFPIAKSIENNPENRCYLCKKFLFSQLQEEKQKRGIAFLADGTNADDLQDYRPGLKALEELEVISPLLENGFSKKDIRFFSKGLDLPTWDKQPMPVF